MSEMFEKLSGGQLIAVFAILTGGGFLICDTIARSWARVRRTEAEVGLKREMLAAGKSAEEIDQVVRATAGKRR